jgi:hypothetical protein
MSEPAAQGEIWTLEGLKAHTHTVVVLDSVPQVARGGLITVAMVIPAHEAPNPRALLTVPITGTEDVVAVFRLGTVSVAQFIEKVGMLDRATLDNVRTALQARFDL